MCTQELTENVLPAAQELQSATTKREGGYLFPLGAETDAAFEAAWLAQPLHEGVTGISLPEADGIQPPVMLPVMFGRTLPVAR